MTKAVTQEQHEAAYGDIVKFYDFAEDLINTVEDEATTNPMAQLEFIEPLVQQVEEATDVLAEEYRRFVQTGKRPGMLNRRKIEKSLAQIKKAIDTCKQVKHGGSV